MNEKPRGFGKTWCETIHLDFVPPAAGGFGLLSTLVGTRLSHQILSSVNRTGRRTLGFEQKISWILLYNSLKVSEFHKNIKDLYFDHLRWKLCNSPTQCLRATAVGSSSSVPNHRSGFAGNQWKALKWNQKYQNSVKWNQKQNQNKLKWN